MSFIYFIILSESTWRIHQQLPFFSFKNETKRVRKNELDDFENGLVDKLSESEMESKGATIRVVSCGFFFFICISICCFWCTVVAFGASFSFFHLVGYTCALVYACVMKNELNIKCVHHEQKMWIEIKRRKKTKKHRGTP